MEVVIGNILVATLLAIVAGAVRCVAGWAENALRDGVIDSFEWKQLAGTMAVYLGTINVLSLGISPGLATVVMVVLDMVRTALGKLGNGTR